MTEFKSMYLKQAKAWELDVNDALRVCRSVSKFLIKHLAYNVDHSYDGPTHYKLTNTLATLNVYFKFLIHEVNKGKADNTHKIVIRNISVFQVYWKTPGIQKLKFSLMHDHLADQPTEVLKQLLIETIKAGLQLFKEHEQKLVEPQVLMCHLPLVHTKQLALQINEENFQRTENELCHDLSIIFDINPNESECINFVEISVRVPKAENLKWLRSLNIK